MEKQEVLDLLEKFINRSERWIEDAENREDSTDIIYYQGQKRVIQDIKDTIDNMWINMRVE